MRRSEKGQDGAIISQRLDQPKGMFFAQANPRPEK